MNAQYATCFLCDDVVYLFKRHFPNTSRAAAAMYRRRTAIVRGGVVLCPRCNSTLNGSDKRCAPALRGNPN
ncbi:unknown [Antheraea pernyi nucleopolyhedrovirus]|uniref:Uncharacterized protein n=2 Tax=Antheraea pernyi nuclear polyhedrosis virus TaxID=161494 RepID=Q1HGZ4_NPVAP|nr:hypothetical protein APNV_p105 [Antheraea pernyi nucleopolyhedrovirus]AWD33626.1 hypothetical protein [Antheraea proylei nucleopolyhedrovirus]BBD50565.1 hypothetical protein [Antheraea yamamai nucleopolyhedrovirus]BBD50717.1 hypothetical protein [Samia cynthia nucleopolyhedrovirus]ABF50339.1 unknown [Antheraea pernyi nucleopolyhedrovirus]ABQ12334.1 unknown [Antheraea pernyi nucleopolyhedrovirus]